MFSDLLGQLKAKRPGDYVTVLIDRNGTSLSKKVKLVKKDRFRSVNYNLEMRDLSKSEKKKLKINYGVKITQDFSNRRESSIKGFVITKINKKKVNSASQVVKFLDSQKRYSVTIEMMNLEGELIKYYIR